MDGPREAHWDLPADPQAVSKVREMVRGTLAAWDVPGGLVDDVELVISELVTNAILYGEPPITMALTVTGRCVGGEISDRGPARPRVPRQRASDDDDHGRGLPIVAALATRWGVDPALGGAGKVVWFRRCWEAEPDAR